MKKKLLVILMILVLAVTAIVATACNDSGMIVKNKERDYKQATAEITYAGRSAQVDKLELNSTIYNFVYQYYSYYQQGYLSQSQYQSVLDNIETSYKQANESLAQTEAYTLKCIEELYKLAVADPATKAAAEAASTVGKTFSAADRIKEIESVLPKKDLIAAVEAYNEEMQSSFDSFREAYEKEIANASSTDKSTDNVKEVVIVSRPWKLVYEKGESLLESGLKVGVKYEGSDEVVSLDRTDYTVTGFSSDEIKEGVEVTVTFADQTATFPVDIVAAKPARPKLPTEDEEEEKTVVPALFEKDLEAKIAAAKTAGDSVEYKALTESKRRLEKQMSANYRNYEYYYLSKLKTQAVSAYEEIVGKAAAGVSEAEINADFAKKLNEQQQALLLGTSKYSEIVDASGVKTQIVHEDGKVFYVQNLLLKLTDDLDEEYTEWEKLGVANKEALEEYKNQLTDKVGVYVSNVEYDKDAKCEEEECTCTACENYKGETPGACADPECKCVKCPNKRFITKAFAEEKGLTYDEETGTINILEIKNAVYADLAELGEDATVAERVANLEKFKKWIYMVNDDDGSFSAFKDGKLGYSLSMEKSSYVESFTDLSRLLAYGTQAEKDAHPEWEIVGTGIGSFGYCYTTYGIHVIMLSGYALSEEYATEANRIDGTDYYALPVDAITDYSSYKEATETTPAEGTLKYGFVDSLESEKKSEATGAFKKKFYQEEMKNDVKITYYEKVYKDLVKAYKQ